MAWPGGWFEKVDDFVEPFVNVYVTSGDMDRVHWPKLMDMINSHYVVSVTDRAMHPECILDTWENMLLRPRTGGMTTWTRSSFARTRPI